MVVKMALRKEAVQKALDSSDPVQIKKVRAEQRGALTRSLKSLKKELAEEQDSESEEVSDDVVREIIRKHTKI